MISLFIFMVRIMFKVNKSFKEGSVNKVMNITHVDVRTYSIVNAIQWK